MEGGALTLTHHDIAAAGNSNDNRSKQLHFHNVQLDSLQPYEQHEVYMSA